MRRACRSATPLEALERAGAALRERIALPERPRHARLARDGALPAIGARPPIIPVHGTDQVADVTGAGDTVLATFSLALASGASPLEAALLANFAGGVVVMKMGTATVTPRGARAARSRATGRSSRERSRKTEDGETEDGSLASQDRRRGRSSSRAPSEQRKPAGRIVFANGAFDLLHAGHVRYLEAAGARATGSSSASTRTAPSGAAKGPARPIVPEAERAEIVAALGLRRRRRALRRGLSRCAPRRAPARRAREGHRLHGRTRYRSGTSSRAYGGRTAIVGDPKDHATTDLIERIRNPPRRRSGSS